MIISDSSPASPSPLYDMACFGYEVSIANHQTVADYSLMEHYDLRSCFQPDLAGLHVRIYQFQELLRHNFPILSAHLDDLRVDPAYVSQWFLSFFAVTCPLPMLFRIY